MWNKLPKLYPFHYFSEEELRDGCRRCLENVRGLLAGAKTLNENDLTQQYALGLYMYAVEEYGKAILLKKAITGNKKQYQIEQWIIGIGDPNNTTTSHDEKMKVGFHNLPKDCWITERGVKIINPLLSTKVVTTKRGKEGPYDKSLILEGVTGRIYDTTNVKIFDHNLDLKTACFYIDWHRDNWSYDVTIQPEELNKKITCLEDALEKGI
jgi:hypothetical protein